MFLIGLLNWRGGGVVTSNGFDSYVVGVIGTFEDETRVTRLMLCHCIIKHQTGLSFALSIAGVLRSKLSEEEL